MTRIVKAGHTPPGAILLARAEQERVLTWLLQVDLDTYYKWQRRGSNTIALILRERETEASRRAA